MASTRRTESVGITRQQHDFVQELAGRPWSYGFFQAVRVLQLLGPGREPVGRFGRPNQAAVRFGAHTELAFPASELQSIERAEDEAPRMGVNFMGSTGPLGVLPLVYTALVRDRVRARDYAARDFLDIFHDRILALFYRAWEKYRFGVAFERGERDQLSHHLSDLTGIGTMGLENRQHVPDAVIQFYAGLFSMNARPAVALEQLLSDYFGVPVEVEQFVGAWHRIAEEHECRLGHEKSFSQQLGVGALAGDRIWDEQSRIRIRLGPLTIAHYRDFLPDGTAHKSLRELAMFYVGLQFDIEIELILKREDVPGCELEQEFEAGVQLGWTTWVKSAPFMREPSDTILQLEQAA